MLINCQFDAKKVAPNTKRYFAENKSQIKKPHSINYAFQKIARYISLKKF